MKLRGNNPVLSSVGPDIIISGDIQFSNCLQICGKVMGNVVSENGTLHVGESGLIEAQVNVDICVVHGTVKGNVTARTHINIAKGGCIHGDVITPVLHMEEGAVLVGAVKMEKGGSPAEDIGTPAESKNIRKLREVKRAS